MPIPLLIDGPESAETTMIVAHGAGAPMDHPFMDAIAQPLADVGIRVIRFEFPYMAARRDGGPKRPPDRLPLLLEHWRAVITQVGACQPIIGGKSLGGRIASMIADDVGAGGLVCLGYPFHPPGKPEKLRTEHLQSLGTPTLILQGERDPFGTAEEVASYPLPPTIRCHYLRDGDHSFKPRKSSGLGEADNRAEAAREIIRFCRQIDK